MKFIRSPWLGWCGKTETEEKTSKKGEPTFRGRGLWRFCGEALSQLPRCECNGGNRRGIVCRVVAGVYTVLPVYRRSAFSGHLWLIRVPELLTRKEYASYMLCYRKFTSFHSGLARGFEASRRRCMENRIGKGLA